MATMITSECINCGACEPECPNTAIYQGGVEWELDGTKHAALTADIFFIVPEKCTECVGFFDHEACAAVCPVDCCVPNPDIPESEAVLVARAKQLHPGTEFGPDFPSRFKGSGAGAAPAGNGADAAAAPAAAAPAATAPAAAAPRPAAAPVATGGAAAAAAVAVARVERPLAPPKPALKLVSAPPPAQPFAQELPDPFEAVEERLGGAPKANIGWVKWVIALSMPVLGGLPWGTKQRIEEGVGDRRFFSAVGATGLNAMLNMLLYPVLALVIGVLVLDRPAFSEQLRGLIFTGFGVGLLETMWRMREGILQARPLDEIRCRASLYGLAITPLAAPLLALLKRRPVTQRGTIAVDGFHSPEFEEKIERERRYGEVYTLIERENGYLLRMEFPRRVPPSAQKLTLGMPDEMPDYKIDLALQNAYFVVSAKLIDPNLRKAAAVSPAFPPDFTARIKLDRRVSGFRHQYKDKVLEVAMLGEA